LKNNIVPITYLSLCLILIGCSGKYIEKVDTPEKQNFHLFLLAGQSNMAGRGIVTDVDKEAHPRIFMLTKENNWVPAVDPIHFDKTSAGVGLAKSFAIELVNNDTNIKVGLIPAACGGSPISTWKPGRHFNQTDSYPYDDAIFRARAAIKHGEIKAILWHQGESDCNKENATRYEERLDSLITNFRKDLGVENIPFIIGQLGQFPGKVWNTYRGLVDKSHQSVAKNNKLVGFVSSDNLSSKPDSIHFDSKSLKIFGKRYVKEYFELLNK